MPKRKKFQKRSWQACSLTGCLLCASKPGKLIAKACALAQNYLLVEPAGGVRAFARFFVRLSASAVTFLMLTELQRPQQLFLVPPSAVRLFFRCSTKFSLSSSQNFLGAKYERGNIRRPVEAPSCTHTGCTSLEPWSASPHKVAFREFAE